jgi:hypothetical protein
MKKKYYTKQEINQYAAKTGAVCTFGGLNLCVFKGWTAKGSYEVKFHRLDAWTWEKKIVKK